MEILFNKIDLQKSPNNGDSQTRNQQIIGKNPENKQRKLEEKRIEREAEQRNLVASVLMAEEIMKYKVDDISPNLPEKIAKDIRKGIKSGATEKFREQCNLPSDDELRKTADKIERIIKKK